jgi:hypothetical protein
MTPQERRAQNAIDAANRAEPKVLAYEALKLMGHSPQKALEIILDAKRGDDRAVRWINFAQGRCS